MRTRKRLTIPNRKRLADWENAAGYEPVAEQTIGMDSHGCNVQLMVIRLEKGKDRPLLGFLYYSNSETNYFEDDPLTLIAITEEEVTVVRYSPSDGTDLYEHSLNLTAETGKEK